MAVTPPHPEPHFIHRSGWIRAAVLGANDGVVSTASLIVGVAAAAQGRAEILIAGVAALVAGAMSMAAGEFVSVSAQRDIERADLEIEKRALRRQPAEELAELAAIYRGRGLDARLADEVALQLTARNALEAHKRDELGITDALAARPMQAAAASAAAFSAGAALPLFAALTAPGGSALTVVPIATLVSLALLGFVSARAGGARPLRSVVRVVAWGAAAMAATAGIGRLIGIAL